MSNKTKSWIAILASSVLLFSGCASVGPAKKIPVTMPGGEKATIVAHEQSVPDYLLARDKLAINYIVKGDVSDQQLAAVAETERACRLYTGIVRPSNLVAVMSQGVLYAAAGFIGVGLGSQAFVGAKYGEYAKYGGAAGLFAGAANGVISLGGQTFTFESCGREILALFPGYEVKVLMKSPY